MTNKIEKQFEEYSAYFQQMAVDGRDSLTKPSSAKPLLAAGAYVERAFSKLEQDK